MCPGTAATKPLDTAAFCQFSFASKFVHVRRLRTLHHNGPDPETQIRGPRRAMARDVSRVRFRPVTCRALAGSARRQAGANPRSRRCSCQSCGRFLESMTSRADSLIGDHDPAFRQQIFDVAEACVDGLPRGRYLPMHQATSHPCRGLGLASSPMLTTRTRTI
jgi:hypothetical protein